MWETARRQRQLVGAVKEKVVEAQNMSEDEIGDVVDQAQMRWRSIFPLRTDRLL